MSQQSSSSMIQRILAIVHREQSFFFLVLIAAFGAIAPHPANVTPIAALGLFSGTYINRNLFLLVPIAALLVADLTGSGFYDLRVMGFVYLGILASSLTGRFLLANRSKIRWLPISILVMSFAFYLLANFGNWWAFYPLTMQGLVDCMVNGLPYFLRTLLGNTLWSVLFIGSYEWLRSRKILQAV